MLGAELMAWGEFSRSEKILRKESGILEQPGAPLDQKLFYNRMDTSENH